MTEAPGVEFAEVLQAQLEEQGMISGTQILEVPSPEATSAEDGTCNCAVISHTALRMTTVTLSHPRL
jgi:hypothetical protein